jgi:hypothetical protein
LGYLTSIVSFTDATLPSSWELNPLPSTNLVLRRNLISVLFSCWHLQNLALEVNADVDIPDYWQGCIQPRLTQG